MFQKNNLFHPEMIPRPIFCLKDTKNTGSLIFNSLKPKKLIANFFVNRNWNKLTDSRKRAKIVANNGESHHPIETFMDRASVSALDLDNLIWSYGKKEIVNSLRTNSQSLLFLSTAFHANGNDVSLLQISLY